MTTQLILDSRLVAIIRLDDLSAAEQIAQTLIHAGVLALEFTLTNPAATTEVERIRRSNQQILDGKAVVGIGSVRSLEEAKIAIDSGAQFVVSPITSVPIIDYCKQNGIAVCPGAYTPSEIAAGWEAGADIIKVFPSRTLGPGFIRDVLAPMPYLKLMPTGGVDITNLQAYFDAGAVAVGIGSQFLDPVAIRNRDWSAIADVAKRYVTACRRDIKLLKEHEQDEVQ
jgi:2-dehydro-3-deoxyphosphogluconate aldolase/(4S)-4-hydroxy-2-oxoglutarate aldolase